MANNFKQVREAARYNPYAVATAAVEKKAGLHKGSHLTKAQIEKRDEIAKKIKANESFDAILESKGTYKVHFHGGGVKHVKFHEDKPMAEVITALHKHYGKTGAQVSHIEPHHVKEAAELPKSIDYSKYDKPTYLRNEKKKEHKKPEWVGKNTDKPAYKRKAEHEGK